VSAALQMKKRVQLVAASRSETTDGFTEFVSFWERRDAAHRRAD